MKLWTCRTEHPDLRDDGLDALDGVLDALLARLDVLAGEMYPVYLALDAWFLRLDERCSPLDRSAFAPDALLVKL